MFSLISGISQNYVIFVILTYVKQEMFSLT